MSNHDFLKPYQESLQGINSMGVASVSGKNASAASLLAQADSTRYSAKHRGRM